MFMSQDEAEVPSESPFQVLKKEIGRVIWGLLNACESSKNVPCLFKDVTKGELIMGPGMFLENLGILHNRLIPTKGIMNHLSGAGMTEPYGFNFKGFI